MKEFGIPTQGTWRVPTNNYPFTGIPPIASPLEPEPTEARRDLLNRRWTGIRRKWPQFGLLSFLVLCLLAALLADPPFRKLSYFGCENPLIRPVPLTPGHSEWVWNS